MLQGFRDTTKATNDPGHWKSAHHASEISAFRLTFPLDVLKMVKSTIVPTMSTTNDESTTDTFIGSPWVWQKKLLFHYVGQDTVLAERMNFVETCKQKPHESIAKFEATRHSAKPTAFAKDHHRFTSCNKERSRSSSVNKGHFVWLAR